MVTAEFWDEITVLLRQVAKDVARKWPHAVVADDVEQDVMVVLVESPGTCSTLNDVEPKIRKQMLFKLAQQEAFKQQIEYEHWSGQYCYETAEVRELLEQGVLTGDTDDYPTETSDLVEAMADMTKTDTGSGYVDAILSRYADGVVPDNDSADRKRLNRAVNALTERMNRIGAIRIKSWTEGPGSRRGRPNGTTIAVTNAMASFEDVVLTGNRS